MSCPNVYRNSGGKVTLKITVKRNGKFTGTLKFTTEYKVSGSIKNGKITVHYVGYPKKYNHSGRIKNKAITARAHNDDVLSAKKCPGGWEQEMKLKKK